MVYFNTVPWTSSLSSIVGPLPSILDGVHLTMFPSRLRSGLIGTRPVVLPETSAIPPPEMRNLAGGSASAVHSRYRFVLPTTRTEVVLNFVFTGLS